MKPCGCKNCDCPSTPALSGPQVTVLRGTSDVASARQNDYTTDKAGTYLVMGSIFVLSIIAFATQSRSKA